MEEIFEAVSGHGQFSPVAIVLDPRYNRFSNRRSGSEVQKRFNRFNVAVVRLDGRRFAYLNARRIRKLAGIP
jgi:hypothetical protein